MTKWYEPADNFAFPIGMSPAGWTFVLGCKFCRRVNYVPSRRYNELPDGTYDRVDLQAFPCDGCGHWLFIRTAPAEYYDSIGMDARVAEIMHA